MRRATTTKKALKITAEHYRWLADNPTDHPSKWPGWDKYGYDLSVTSRDKNPLCEVATGKCGECPLIALWIEGSGNLPKEQRLKSCLVRTSPFMVRTNLYYSIKEEDKKAALTAARAIYLEAEYALENGIREPDLSIYLPKREKRATRAVRETRVARQPRAARTKPSGRVRRGI
jgi:hypothetical protein